MQRIIITGGSGLIGRPLTTELTARGYEVVILSRRPDAASTLPAGARVVGWDGRSAQGWGELADGAYAIVNLAGATIARPPWTEIYKRAIVASRVNAGRAVVAAVQAAAQKPSVLVQASAVGYYGVRSGETIAESAPSGDDYLADRPAVPHVRGRARRQRQTVLAVDSHRRRGAGHSLPAGESPRERSL